MAHPHAYSANYKIDAKGLAKFKGILDNHVTPFLPEYDKVPNIDGQMEILDE